VPEQQTCGQGLANNSVLPAKLGEVMDAVAGNLEAHMESLDRSDPDAQAEYDVYVALGAQHREIAADLRATAETMGAQRDLPMGRHDPEIMSAPKAVAAFERLVAVEQELAELLEQRHRQYEAMLAAARGDGQRA
jgi:hypothetical protein